MTTCKGSVAEIESFGLTDGPGIRTVVFLNGCMLRCKYCHNPEMQERQPALTTPDEIVKKALRNKPYFKRNGGGVTFSGGEPLLQPLFLLEACQKLRAEGIHIALDTAGIGLGRYDEILANIDLVLLDIKHITPEGYQEITTHDYLDRFFEFVEALNKSGKPVWIRQVVVPEVHDSKQYMRDLAKFLKKHLKNVERVDFLPYHKLGSDKYEKLGRTSPYKDKPPMDVKRCDELYRYFCQHYPC